MIADTDKCFLSCGSVRWLFRPRTILTLLSSRLKRIGPLVSMGVHGVPCEGNVCTLLLPTMALWPPKTANSLISKRRPPLGVRRMSLTMTWEKEKVWPTGRSRQVSNSTERSFSISGAT